VTKPGEIEQARKRILILAGPNGAGKTTFAREFLPDEAQCPTFVNADLIAAGLSPFRPELAAMRAGRLMLELIGDLVARGESFAFETTLADRGYIRRIAEWQNAGYHVTILFLSLQSVDTAIQRVRLRIAQGGHSIPEDVIRRRFAVGKANFEKLYKPRADAWALYDSSGRAPVLLDWSEKR
jgi:predicted ABC-type ATPase